MILVSSSVFAGINQSVDDSAGFRITTDIMFDSSTSDYYVLDEIVNDGFANGLFLPSSSSEFAGVYNINLDKNYASNLSGLSLIGCRNRYICETLGVGGNLTDSHLDLGYSFSSSNMYSSHDVDGGVKLCNDAGGCSSFLRGNPWKTNSYSTVSTGGFKVSFNSHFDSSTSDYYVLDEIVNSAFDLGYILPLSTSVGGVYNLDLSKPYATDLNDLDLMILRNGYSPVTLGSGGIIIGNHFGLTYSTVGVDSALFENLAGGVKICNEYGGCSSFLPALSWGSGSYSQTTFNGISFASQVELLEAIVPVYDSSVPEDNLKTLDTDFFFSVDLNGNIVNGAWLNFSSVLYPMNCNLILCNVSISDVSPGEHSYHVIYDFGGTNISLSSQSMEVFSTDSSGGAVPAFGGLSYLIFTLIFGLGSMFSLRGFKE